MKKRYLYPLFLVCVFLIGALGHWLTKPVQVEERVYVLTFYSENVNSLLLYELPKEGDTLFFLDTSCTVLGAAHTPRTLYGRHEGSLLSRSSLLFSDVTFTVSARAHERNGRLTIGERPLPIGEEIVLYGENFSLRARFTGFSAGF